MRHLLLLALLAPMAAAAGQIRNVPDDAHELVACSEARLLRELGLLTVPATDVRDDRPIALLRDEWSHLLWAQWTKPGEESTSTTGDLKPGTSAPLLDLVDPSEPGCWMWTRDPGAVFLFAPDGKTGRGLFSDAALKDALKLDASALGTRSVPVQKAPRSNWVPAAQSRFMTERMPIPAPGPNEGKMGPNAMVAGLLGLCGDWTPGTTLAIAQQELALFCPHGNPRKALGVMEAEFKRDKNLSATRTGDVLHLEGPFLMLPHVVALDDGLLYTNSVALADDVAVGAGEEWWTAEAPSTGVIQRTPDAAVHVERADSLTRVELLFTEAFSRAVLDLTPEPVSSLVPHVSEGKVDGVIGGEQQ